MVAGVQSNESLTESNDTFLVRWGVFVHNVKCKAHTEVRRMNNYEFNMYGEGVVAVYSCAEYKKKRRKR